MNFATTAGHRRESRNGSSNGASWAMQTLTAHTGGAFRIGTSRLAHETGHQE